jgi:hypothetical protein
MARAIAIFFVIAIVLLGGRAGSAAANAIVVIPSGYGDITANVEVDGTPYRCTNDDLASTGCPLDLPVGQRVTFTAEVAPVTGPESTDLAPSPPVESKFVGWSRPECEGATSSCTITVEDDPEPVVAQFTPVWLEVLISGVGTIEANDVPSTCTTERCIIGHFENGARVWITSQTPNPIWGFGCDPFDSDLLAGRCLIELSNTRNFVSVGFQANPDPEPPYNLSKPVTVRRRGSGNGRVHGKGTDAGGNTWQINCGSDCKLAGVHDQTRIRLAADEAAGSTFQRWSGPPCGPRRVCTFTAGKYPTVRATFGRAASASSVPPSGTAPGPGVREAPFSMSVIRARAKGRRAKRRIVVTLTTNRSARATLRLTRRGRRVIRKVFALPAGTRTIRARVPRRTRAGWYRMSLAVSSADGTRKSFAKRLHLRR